MAHGFDDYRIFISAPGDLGAEVGACHQSIADVNTAIAMPEQILLVGIGLREAGQIVENRAIVSDNVRWSSYFIQIFEDDWGPRDLYRKLFQLAVDCREDEALPMRDVVVFLKDSPNETNPQVLEFRKELAEHPGVQVIPYKTPTGLAPQLEEVLQAWAQDLVAQKQKEAPQPAEAGSLL